ncbi:hypothetical protein HG535_0H03550 [Zygotorulaspora mrakii]|uniref:Uncharacterized protein n=1 Tax=Zygotorulaspora mrakii TaxID=42260 RepID=A0A7H9B8E3_ZYGMR|nr:uncharacterized protein HG535_0H03550 [Zygotorulaspora mrakii]QLG75028.1 hypothetical protein HG535_0H03550 [Zygotorulaspora mrakii]
MMLSFVRLAFLFSLLGAVLGDVTVVSPERGQTFSGSSGTVSITVEWMDNGAYPPTNRITSYDFTLNYGPNDNIDAVGPIRRRVAASDVTRSSNNVYSYTVSFRSDFCGNGQYYIQVFSAVDGSRDSYTINYSPRFRLTSMQGSTTFTYTDTTQPGGQTRAYTNTQTSSASIDTRSFTVPYPMQTGISRFAPMQLQPATRMTATTWTRRFTSSAVTYYSTFRTTLDQVTTITPGWSYTLPSGFNRASPALYPSQNGGGYDPKEKQSLSTRKINQPNRNGGSSSSSDTSSSSNS